MVPKVFVDDDDDVEDQCSAKREGNLKEMYIFKSKEEEEVKRGKEERTTFGVQSQK